MLVKDDDVNHGQTQDSVGRHFTMEWLMLAINIHLTSHFESGKVSLQISWPGLGIGWTIIIVSPVE